MYAIHRDTVNKADTGSSPRTSHHHTNLTTTSITPGLYSVVRVGVLAHAV